MATAAHRRHRRRHDGRRHRPDLRRRRARGHAPGRVRRGPGARPRRARAPTCPSWRRTVWARPTTSRTPSAGSAPPPTWPTPPSGADVVVECVFEDLALKQDVFERLDAACPPETILCTNTSVMSITEIAEKATHKERIVGTHFWNPPYLIPLVEVVRTERGRRGGRRPHHGPAARAWASTPSTARRTCPASSPTACSTRCGARPSRSSSTASPTPRRWTRASVSAPGCACPSWRPWRTPTWWVWTSRWRSTTTSCRTSRRLPSRRRCYAQKVDAGELGFKTGRGFADWSPEAADASRKRLVAYLVHVLGDPARGF